MTNDLGPSEVQHEIHLVATADLLLRARPLHEIARKLSVSQTTALSLAKEVGARWRASSIRDFDVMRAEEYEKTLALEREYWDAWEQSKKTRTITSTGMSREQMTEEETGRDVSPRKTRMTKRVEERDGNPAFLAGVMTCIEKRCRLFGLDAPTTVNTEVTLKQLVEELAEKEGMDKDLIPLVIQQAGEIVDRLVR